jgi:ribonuclease HI
MKEIPKKKTAYSYLSYVNGRLQRHTTWKECEAVVKGRSGAKFKKAMSPEEEEEIVASWGVPLDRD